MTVAKKKKPSPKLDRLSSTTPKWVSDMHEHFREKGFYRTEDLNRVLGDPRQSVGMEATTNLNQLAKNRLR